MNPRVKEALLWGVIGLLTFLVLLQGYEILDDAPVDLPVKVGAAIVVGVASTAVTYLARGRVAPGEPATDGAAADEPAVADRSGDGGDPVDRDENETS